MGLGFRAYKGIGILEKRMGTTVMGHAGIIGHILGLYRDNGKEHGNYCNILGLYRDNGKKETTIMHWGYTGKADASCL